MTCTKIKVLILVTTLTLSALAISSASATATPLCYKVLPGEHGTFTNSNCTASGTGEYAEILYPAATVLGGGVGCAQLADTLKVGLWTDAECKIDSSHDEGEYIKILLFAGGTAKPKISSLPTVKTFKGTSKATTLNFAGNAVICTKGTDRGEITGTTTVGKVVMTASGCTLTNSKKEVCTAKSTGQSESSSEILTHSLKGELGTVKSKEAMSEVGLLLEPETTKKLIALATSKCSPEVTLEGAIAGEVNPISVKQANVYLIFEASSGKQDIQQITVSSGEKKPVLEVAGGEKEGLATEETVDEIEFAGPIEIV